MRIFCHELQTRPSSRELLCLVSFLDLARTKTPVHAHSLHAKSAAPTRIQRTRCRSLRPCWSRLLRTATRLPATRLHANAACFLSVALRLIWRAARQRDSSSKQYHVLNARYRLPILHVSKIFLRSAQVSSFRRDIQIDLLMSKRSLLTWTFPKHSSSLFSCGKTLTHKCLFCSLVGLLCSLVGL